MKNQMITTLLSILRYSNSFCVDLLLYVQNVYQKTLNMEMVYHVTWVMLIKSTLFVETTVIKNIIHENTHKKSKKVKNVENMIVT